MRRARRQAFFIAILFLISMFHGGPRLIAEERGIRPLRVEPQNGKSPIIFRAYRGELYLLDNQNYYYLLRQKIEEARKEVVLCTYLFKVGKGPGNRAFDLKRSLMKAKKRGVRILAILERSEEREEVDLINKNTGDILRRAGVEVLYDPPDRITHAKVAVIDGRYSFIGSHNLTHTALKYSNELSVMVDSENLARSILDYLKGLPSGDG